MVSVTYWSYGVFLDLNTLLSDNEIQVAFLIHSYTSTLAAGGIKHQRYNTPKL